MTRVSIIIPVRNEAAVLPALLDQLQNVAQVIVVDGGSTDETRALALAGGASVVDSEPGRAGQMNLGAAQATGDVLVFLHADTKLPADFLVQISHGIAAGALWGRFDVRLSGTHPMFRVIAGMMNLRSRLTGICTGDQCLFVRRDVFNQVGGYPQIPLMEDIELSSRLRKLQRPCCIRSALVTSSRRWEAQGILRTILLMWKLRLKYFLGVPASKLVREYYSQ
ncbi:MAG: TIGR04283 family arsenosugar biosynthesis glycosyltransferase [Pseudomonadales bacterium]|nr:TIGR04283 family arsenosugar biosynthesis glycosyltransferase [Pseudomonadales bacterium]